MSPASNTTASTEYRRPDPTKGEDYRYTLLLFDQPANFTIPTKFDQWIGPHAIKRINFDFPGFVKDTGLQQPVAANFFFARK